LNEIGIRQRWNYIELRGGAENLIASIPCEEFVVHRLGIEGDATLQRNKIHDSHRRNIQRSRREGVQVEHLQTWEAMEAFYRLHCRTRRRHGLPPQPVRFFKLIHDVIIDSGLGFVSLARYLDRWIAGAVFLKFGSRAIYKFGASDPAFQHTRANNLVMWEAINRLRETAVSELSFGRTDLSDGGLLRFKRGWGAKEIPLRYNRIWLRGRAARRVPEASRNNWRSKVVQRTPIPLLRLVGALAYRHMG
jgi:hypothetical protein